MPLYGAIVAFQRCCASLEPAIEVRVALREVRRVGGVFCASLACIALAMRRPFSGSSQ